MTSARQARRLLVDRSLRTRLLLPAVAGGLAVLAVAGFGYQGQRALTGRTAELLRDTQVLQNHLTGDMMHDAIRADVLAVLLSSTPDQVTEHTAEIEEHAGTFLTMQDDNLALVRDDRLHTALVQARPALDAYVAQARAIAAAAATDPAHAQDGLPEFVTAFDALAVSQEALTEQVASHNEETAGRAAAQSRSSRRTLLAICVAALLVMLLVGTVVARTVTGPVSRLRRRLQLLGAGDLSATATEWDGDELGDMGRDLEHAQSSLRRTIGTIATNATSLAAAAHELSDNAESIAASAEGTSVQSGQVSHAADEVSRHVQTVADGADLMGTSIRGIAEDAAEAARVGQTAVSVAAATDATVRRLGDSSAQIGAVVKTITTIAEQTNLLALNATIEAARAGELGKGFAVVANEVKELAQETARATEDIGRRVEAIQTDTAGAVAALAEVGSVIARMNSYQTSIAAAVERQTGTTREMTGTVAEAAQGSSRISEGITGVAASASVTSRGAQAARDAVAELGRRSADLQDLVSSFRV